MVHGPTRLRGTHVDALDIRSGAAMVLAGLAAEGVTEIGNVVYIDRGYEDLVGKLQGLGAHVSLREESVHEVAFGSREQPVEWGVVPFAVEGAK